MSEYGYAEVNNQSLHYATVGNGGLILFLHGFPEFWYVWRHQLPVFGQTYQAVAPDLRGYNLSSKPTEQSAYRLPLLVDDIAALITHLGQRSAVVVGHDWGGVVAWELAQAHPALVTKLVIINAPHPVIFRHMLAYDAAQQQASAYIPRLCLPQAEAVLTANHYAALSDIVIKPGLQQGYFTAADHQAYLDAWSQPGAIGAALQYYRANDFRPGMAASVPATAPAYHVIAAPTLVIWGEKDTALLPGNLEGLEQHVANLTIERVADGTHAIIHEKPALVNQRIQNFLHAAH